MHEAAAGREAAAPDTSPAFSATAGATSADWGGTHNGSGEDTHILWAAMLEEARDHASNARAACVHAAAYLAMCSRQLIASPSACRATYRYDCESADLPWTRALTALFGSSICEGAFQ